MTGLRALLRAEKKLKSSLRCAVWTHGHRTSYQDDDECYSLPRSHPRQCECISMPRCSLAIFSSHISLHSQAPRKYQGEFHDSAPRLAFSCRSHQLRHQTIQSCKAPPHQSMSPAY